MTTDAVLLIGRDTGTLGSSSRHTQVGFGSSSKPHHRQLVEYHASRLREQTAYGEVVRCYLLQNPAVECVRYNITNPSAVAVPLFMHSSSATEEEIPEKLELDRGGIEYATPLGDAPRVTDALAAEVEKQRTLGPTAGSSVDGQQPVATDGDGRH